LVDVFGKILLLSDMHKYAFFFAKLCEKFSRDRDGLGTDERRTAHVVTENHSILKGVKFESITEKMNLCLVLNLSSPCIFCISVHHLLYKENVYS
jgi:hypothetical protein